MFDVKPVDEAGNLDMSKIGKRNKPDVGFDFEQEKDFRNDFYSGAGWNEKKEEPEDHTEEMRIYGYQEAEQKKSYRKKITTTAIFVLGIVVIFLMANFVSKGWRLKNNGLAKAQAAMAEILSAKEDMLSGDFDSSRMKFEKAQSDLATISRDLDGLGKVFVGVTKYFPYISKVSSASHLVSAGESVSRIGIIVSETLDDLDSAKTKAEKGEGISYLKLFKSNEKKLDEIFILTRKVQADLDEVKIEDLNQADANRFLEIKKALPEINAIMAEFSEKEKILTDILGGNGPRKYLFLFQNNQEMRATGGFIGSYGLLDIFDGRVRKFFIDGIFNPDGQLKARIVPPEPIQKISVNWSLHDSNWFPDFPVSAEKAIWFYEKTGGPTVDGVIAMTPTVMQKLLSITGPIEMPEYEVTVDKDNFVEKIQYEVEEDYDKELNRPKKILSDLAPKILDKLFNAKDFSSIFETLNVLLESLNEKQILVYSKNQEVQKFISDNIWSGEILDTPKDYLSVINSNINGFKTDGVVEEEISHEAEIKPDGSIIDTLTITRHHNGGSTSYDWWNRVNSNYMRVYLPKGSVLLEAEGQTREINEPPVDYTALGYMRDKDLQAQKNETVIDKKSGTRIYEEAGKTVFANWAYVSPQETVRIKYVYLLPFKIKDDLADLTSSYSLLAQKQSGSLGSILNSKISYPANLKVLWKNFPEDVVEKKDLSSGKVELENKTILRTDNFFGLAFSE